MGRMAVQGSRASSGCGFCGVGAIHPMYAPIPARVLRPRTPCTRHAHSVHRRQSRNYPRECAKMASGQVRVSGLGVSAGLADGMALTNNKWSAVWT